jgi:hypothetical protein
MSGECLTYMQIRQASKACSDMLNGSYSAGVLPPCDFGTQNSIGNAECCERKVPIFLEDVHHISAAFHDGRLPIQMLTKVIANRKNYPKKCPFQLQLPGGQYDGTCGLRQGYREDPVEAPYPLTCLFWGSHVVPNAEHVEAINQLLTGGMEQSVPGYMVSGNLCGPCQAYQREHLASVPLKLVILSNVVMHALAQMMPVMTVSKLPEAIQNSFK